MGAGRLWTWIFDRILLIQKQWLLHRVKREDQFFREFFKVELYDDRQELVKQYEEMKQRNNKDEAMAMNELQAKIVKLGEIEQRLKNDKRVEEELLCFIRTLKQ